MLRTLIVGLGRAGLGLHWHVLRRLRASEQHAGFFSAEPPVACDIRDIRGIAAENGLVAAGSLAEAPNLLDPATTMVHLCTPPTTRLAALQELAELGFRWMVVEKPLATDQETLDAIVRLADVRRLRIGVVSHWLDSELTRRAIGFTRSAELGTLRAISVVQRKPRLSRTLRAGDHPTAFDVELPHSLGVALRIAGDAKVTDAACTDLRIGDLVVPRMGAAHLVLQHGRGARSEIFSDLGSPLRERRITLDFEGGRLVGYYPGSQDDHYAHLTVYREGGAAQSVFRDDSLAAFLTRLYQDAGRGADFSANFAFNAKVAAMLCDAKSRFIGPPLAYLPDPAVTGAVDHVS